jgi:hypothetical protein
MNNFFLKMRKPELLFDYKLWAAIFIFFGILIRLLHYFYNPSLWMDEVYLSSSLIRMSIHDLVTKPLDYQQKAPLGFLMMVKMILLIFGNNEMALRLFSLLSGILSLFVFIPVGKFFTGKTGMTMGLGILAFAPALVFHSVEIKQYQVEMLATLMILYTYIKYHRDLSYAGVLTWGIIGAIIIWFSYSSIFVLAGIGAAHVGSHFFANNRKLIIKQLIPGLMWVTSFLLNFVLFTHRHAESKWIVYWFDFHKTFMPFPPGSVAELKWFPLTLYRLLDYPLGMTWGFRPLSAILPLLFLVLGFFAFRKSKLLLLLCFPFVFVFIASGLKLYPLTERFWVFISPILVLLMSSGLVLLSKALKQRLVVRAIAVVLLAGPVINSARYLLYPKEFIYHKRSFEREALAYVNRHFQAGDVVYVYWNNLPGFRIYKSITDLKFSAVEGLDHRYQSASYNDYLNKLKADFRVFNGKKRIWLMYNNYYRSDIGDPIDEPGWYYLQDQAPIDRMIGYFSSLGDQHEVFTSFDVKVNLIKIEKD